MRGYVKRVSQKANKLSNEQLLSLLDDMVEENENLSSILESLSTGLLIVDENFILQQSNTIVESRLTFNVHIDEIKASSVPIWEIILDKDISDFFKNCKEKEITNCNEDFTILTPGGQVRFITITMTPFIHNGKLDGRTIVVMDITENKNQEIMLHRMENMANLTNLAAGMAHEIKNPLGAISIHIQLIQKALQKARENNNILPDKKFLENHIDVVNEEIDHLNMLVLDFLLAVRPVKATLELKDPEKIISNIVDFLYPEFNKANVRIEFNSLKKSQKILIDEKLFKDVLMNLAQNSLSAIKTAQNNDGYFIINSILKDNKFILEISDNGCGMDSVTLSKIFEPYYTTKANGTGLGMTMVYKIIKEFSGEILVESQENIGTKFTIILPLPQKDKKLLTTDRE